VEVMLLVRSFQRKSDESEKERERFFTSSGCPESARRGLRWESPGADLHRVPISHCFVPKSDSAE